MFPPLPTNNHPPGWAVGLERRGRHTNRRTTTTTSSAALGLASPCLSLRGGDGFSDVMASIDTGTAAASTSSSMAWIRQAGWDMGVVAVPSLLMVLFCFWLELRWMVSSRKRQQQSRWTRHPRTTEQAQLEQVKQQLHAHRQEKMIVLRRMTPRVVVFSVLIPLVASICLKKSNMPWQRSFWDAAVSATQFGYWIASAVLMLVVDSAMDECAPIQPRISTATAVLTYIAIVYQLTTRGGGGHISFTMDAISILVGTALGGTIDNMAWIVIATGATTLLALSAAWGWWPSLPSGGSVTRSGVLAYLVWKSASQSIYQMLQNVAKERVPMVQFYKEFFSILAIAIGMPVSWALRDFASLLIAFALKVVVDSVALASL